MEIEKKDYLVTGTPNKKTQEKIRLKIRFILNNYKKCVLGVTHLKDIPRIAYEFDLRGYKYLFFVYKSTSLDKINAYKTHFLNMHYNELITEEYEDIKNVDIAYSEGPMILYIFGKSKKRVF